MTTRAWTPHEGPQTIALAITVFELLYGGARGGGKTDAGIVWLVKDQYHEHPMYRALVLRKNAEDLKDWTDRAERFFSSLGAVRVGHPAEFHFPSGAKIITGHLKDKDAYTKYQGQEYQRELFEELTHIPSEDHYLMVLGSCRSTVPELVPGIFATTNPNGKGHTWVKRRFVQGPGVPKRPGTVFVDPVSGRTRCFIPAKVEDNPTLINNDPGYVQFLNSLPKNLRKAWREGSWSVVAGQFFDTWNPLYHVIKPFKIPSTWLRFICLDYGWSHHAAVYWCAIEPSTGKVYTYRELYVKKHTYDMLIRAIAEMTELEEKIAWMVCDSSIGADGQELGKTGLEIFQEVLTELKWSLRIRLATKGPGSRVHGWNIMRSYMAVSFDPYGTPKTQWQVFSTCENLIRVMPEQMIDENNIEDLDTDGEDDAPDAMRYGLKAIREPIEKPKKPVTGLLKTRGLTKEDLFDKLESGAEANE